jgi:holo-[acyl-carrier protein] synthase
MIFGIGTDLVAVERIERLWRKHGEKFAERILMPPELERFDPQKRPVRYLAMRFAAKEAIVKALGTGFAHGVWVRDVGIRANRWGRPEPIFSARGQALREKLGAGEGYVTLTDESGLIVAVAVLLMAGVPGPGDTSGMAQTAVPPADG